MDKYLNNIDLILDALKIRFDRTSGRYFFECPIHGSSKYNSLSIYENTGKWRCFTEHCEQIHGDNFFNFVGAVLHSEPFDIKDGKQFCDNVLNGIPQDIVSKPKPPTKQKFKFKEIIREQILSYVNPNIPFYLRRGYSKETLTKYDLFICSNRVSPFYGRVVVPVYNDEHTSAIGLLGRSLHTKCEECEMYHAKNKPCPTTSYEKAKSSKWINSKGFARNSSLFNFWFAKDEINRTGKVILVESPGNVMKLAQAGIINAVGIFGTELSKKQIEKIKGTKAKQIYMGLDNDKGGLAAWNKISNQLREYECFPFIPYVNDFGGMSDNEIKLFAECYL